MSEFKSAIREHGQGFVACDVNDGDEFTFNIWPTARADGAIACLSIVSGEDDLAVIADEAACIKLRDMLNARFPI